MAHGSRARALSALRIGGSSLSFRVLAPLLLVVVATSFVSRAARQPSASSVGYRALAARAIANDNRRPAGSLSADGVLTVHLEARVGDWHPDGDAAPGRRHARVRRDRQGARRFPARSSASSAGTTRLGHGPQRRCLTTRCSCTVSTRARRAAGRRDAHRSSSCRARQREVRFELGAPGTYYYWATTMGRTIQYRTREDAQLDRRDRRRRTRARGPWIACSSSACGATPSVARCRTAGSGCLRDQRTLVAEHRAPLVHGRRHRATGA